MAVALLDLHEATGEGLWRAEAERLVEAMDTHFWDECLGGYFYTSHDHEALIARMKSNEDGAIPSGNSMAALALVRLGQLAERPGYTEKARRVIASYAEVMRRAPAAFANMLLAADLLLEGIGSDAERGRRGDAESLESPRPRVPASPRPDAPQVRVETDVTTAEVRAGGRVRVEVRLTIPEGWHLNSHQPLQEYLIPTELRLEPGETYQLMRVDYPEGETVTLPFSPEPLSVYQGTVTLAAEVRVPPSLGAGTHTIPIRVSYQACSDRECLAPADATVEARLLLKYPA
jgi:hypothetical protein